MLILIGVAGGLAIFLYGMQIAGDALQRVLGNRLKEMIAALTRNRFMGLGLGAVVTFILQSSSAMTVMLVGFANAGIMNLSQSLALILGSTVGTTFTVQLIAFRVTDLAFLFTGIGFFWTMVAGKSGSRYIGQSILGFGLIFVGMKIMSDTMAPLRSDQLIKDILLGLSGSPGLSVVISAAFTALIQSSAATIGIAIALGSQGAMPLPVAVAMIFGANIGTTTTGLLASVGASTEAKRIAVVHLIFKVLGVALFFPFMRPFADLVARTAVTPSHQIANAHTIFNATSALLLIPFTGFFAKLICALMPEKDRKADEEYGAKYLDPYVLDTPAIALGQATREILRMAELVQDMVHKGIKAILDESDGLIDELSKEDNKVDVLNREITRFLTRLSQENLTDEQSRREIGLLFIVSELERIGDIVDKGLIPIARKRAAKNITFSQEGRGELIELHGLVSKNLEHSIDALATGDRELASRVMEDQSEINALERKLHENHIARLHSGIPESIDSSSLHLDAIYGLRRINTRTTTIAEFVSGKM